METKKRIAVKAKGVGVVFTIAPNEQKAVRTVSKRYARKQPDASEFICVPPSGELRMHI